MSTRTIDQAVATAYALACFAVVLAPALAVRWGVLRAGIGGVGGRDLLLASCLVGAAHAVVAWVRLRSEERTALRRSHMWIASLNALVVLALAGSVLLLLVLHSFPDEHAAIARRGYPVVALWAGIQVVAVALAEATGRFFFWWLEPHCEARQACRWGVLPPVRQVGELRHLRHRLPAVPRPAWRRAQRPAPGHAATHSQG